MAYGWIFSTSATFAHRKPECSVMVMFVRVVALGQDAFVASLDLDRGVLGTRQQVSPMSLDIFSAPDWSPDQRSIARPRKNAIIERRDTDDTDMIEPAFRRAGHLLGDSKKLDRTARHDRVQLHNRRSELASGREPDPRRPLRVAS